MHDCDDCANGVCKIVNSSQSPGGRTGGRLGEDQRRKWLGLYRVSDWRVCVCMCICGANFERHVPPHQVCRLFGVFSSEDAHTSALSLSCLAMRHLATMFWLPAALCTELFICLVLLHRHVCKRIDWSFFCSLSLSVSQQYLGCCNMGPGRAHTTLLRTPRASTQCPAPCGVIELLGVCVRACTPIVRRCCKCARVRSPHVLGKRARAPFGRRETMISLNRYCPLNGITNDLLWCAKSQHTSRYGRRELAVANTRAIIVFACFAVTRVTRALGAS